MYTQLQEERASGRVDGPEIKPLRRKHMELIRKMWRDEDGQDVVEYALIAVLLAIASIATMTTLGTTISAQWTTITNKL